jgi:hypothetical protein
VRPETLQSLSVGIVFIGLFLAALGGFGALHFGQRATREEEHQRTVAVQALAEVVGSLRKEQGGLLARVASVEEKVAEGPAPSALASTIPSFNPPPAVTFAPGSPVPPTSQKPPTSKAEPFALASAPPVTTPNPLLPHLPPIASGPGPADEEEPAAPAIKPPRLPAPPAPAETSSPSSGPPSVAAREEEGPLTWQKRIRLIKRLRNHPQHAIVIRAAAENAQAVKLAITLKSIFREAGWNVGEIEMVSRPLPAHTLLLSTGVFPPPKEFVAAYAALAGTGVLVTSDLDPNQSRQRVVVSVGPIR